MRSFLLFVLSFVIVFAHGQNIRLERVMPPLEMDGESLRLGFAGGLNSPQFSKVDLDADGIEELFVFDRVGNVPIVFKQDGQGEYQLAPELLAVFPQDLSDWVLLRDYNGDGAQDLFAFNSSPAFGIRVYKGRYIGGLLQFERLNFPNPVNILYFPLVAGGNSQLYVSDIDIPSIDDLDCDGDLDILTFNIGGGFLELYKNNSIERGFQRDTLLFTLADDCWGGIYESGLSPELDLAPSPAECANGLLGDEVTPRHVGSSILTLDRDGDGDKDLMLGDLSFPNINASINGGTCADAWIVSQDGNYPSNDVPADLPIFPAAFHLDIDNDQRRDLIVAPNAAQGVVDFNQVWVYSNTGTDNNPVFERSSTDFLVGDMLDMGSGCQPAFLDYNADGLQDIVIGNFSFFELFGLRNARLYLLENVGTAQAPAFRLVDDDYLGLNQFSNSTFNFAPTFGDLDADGDLDALVGEQNGRLFYAENTAGPGAPVQFAAPVYNYMDILIGLASVPQIIDLNRDGLADLVIGERSGNINYFQNQGTPTNPMFDTNEEALPNVRRLGGVDMRLPGFTTGYASPWFVDLDGEYQLYAGNQFGQVRLYSGIEQHLDGTDFTLVTDNVDGLREGSFVHPRATDLNADGFLDLLIGNYRGGMSLFRTNQQLDGTVGQSTVQLAPTAAVTLSPNPSNGQFRIDWQSDQAPTHYRVLDLNGRVIQSNIMGTPHTTCDASAWPNGLYLVQIFGKHGLLSVGRWVKGD